ncbi:alpha/beta fold hydrolase [Intrasporangium sp. DVR]|uniref:alpha/beta hydrolase n=1 Tax=Intrasporangium sp. DVR TaxID=3127867 RepID=UPI00313A699D
MVTRGRSGGRRRLTRLGVVALALGLAVVVAVGVMAGLHRRLIYFPDSSAAPPAGTVIAGARDVVLRTFDGLELGAWFVPARSPTGEELAVLVAPGNGGHREGRAGLARELSRRGLAVLLMDYRGYGGNPGTPSEEGLLIDAAAAVAALADLGYPPGRTIYFGESLGTGVVAALQSATRPAGIVLRSPFPSLVEVGAHHYPWLPVRRVLRDRFEVESYLAESTVPATVIDGDRDSIVPPGLSAGVADAAPGLVERLVLAGADHNDEVMFGPEVADAVLRLAEHVS